MDSSWGRRERERERERKERALTHKYTHKPIHYVHLCTPQPYTLPCTSTHITCMHTHHTHRHTHTHTLVHTHHTYTHTHTHTHTFCVLNSSMASPTKAPTHFGSSSSDRSKANRALLSLPSLRKQRPSPKRTFPKKWEWE